MNIIETIHRRLDPHKQYRGTAPEGKVTVCKLIDGEFHDFTSFRVLKKGDTFRLKSTIDNKYRQSKVLKAGRILGIDTFIASTSPYKRDGVFAIDIDEEKSLVLCSETDRVEDYGTGGLDL